MGNKYCQSRVQVSHPINNVSNAVGIVHHSGTWVLWGFSNNIDRHINPSKASNDLGQNVCPLRTWAMKFENGV